MKFASAKRKQYNEDLAFRVYVTDGIKALIECWGGEVRQRYIDIIAVTKEETRTADEIIETISDKLSLLGGE